MSRGAVGVVGLGQIGGGVAAALCRAGWEVAGCDVRAPAAPLPVGLRLVATPADVAMWAPTVLVAVLDDAQVRDVLEGDGGLLGAARAPATIIVLSTVAVRTLESAANAAAPAGAAIVDCGVSGGAAAAAEGRLVAMVGGSADAVRAARPVIESFAQRVIHAGALGAGMRLKLARNLVTYGSWLVVDEASRLVAASGIATDALVEAIRASDPMTGGATALVSGDPARRPAPPALAAIAHKDLRAALELGAESGVPMPAGELADRFIDDVVRRTAADAPTMREER
ncbi:NAD(P)-dependent oxidoreductase [Capillimicrobium parvum]|uniref:Oxidoreductase n=1 Tax=Capillimicrobium parvum TaxID=2884022 RepID=A0A9E6XV93_9ACTN|nr:NAD(P)-binding domain-containing protein [Capillimicrobium parvum]UGS34825.1 putative oxidoreductase [Capillimicrobium parvum]